MEFSEEAQKLLDSIVERTLVFTDFLVWGDMVAHFTPLLRDPYTLKFLHEEIQGSPKVQKRLKGLIRHDEIVALRDMTVDSEKGSWFSFSITVNVDENWKLQPEDKAYTLDFNYDKRFNVLSDDWSWDPYELTYPTADIYIASLEKHPRREEHNPEWMNEAYEELDAEKSLFSRDLEEVFEDQLDEWPEMYGPYARGEDTQMWPAFWDKCIERIHDHLSDSKYTARPFYDDRFKFMQKQSLIWRIEEISENSSDALCRKESMEIEAEFYNSYLLLVGHKPGHGPFHDLDNLNYKEVKSNFVDITFTLLLYLFMDLFPEIDLSSAADDFFLTD